MDSETAHLWGDISARAQQAGLILPVVDGLLAATALRHGLHVMTHTTTHFAATGVLIVDPWKESENEQSKQNEKPGSNKIDSIKTMASSDERRGNERNDHDTAAW